LSEIGLNPLAKIRPHFTSLKHEAVAILEDAAVRSMCSSTLVAGAQVGIRYWDHRPQELRLPLDV
jgi:hypothetical protein